MELFLDSADVSEIQKWLKLGVIDGVTTNPSIMLRDHGYDMEARVKEIANTIHPRPISVEVYSNDPDEMLIQGRYFAQWAPNVVVKIPVINEFGEPSLGLMSILESSNIRVNLTACLSFGQVAMGVKAGASYCSLFSGRVSDEGNDSFKLIQQTTSWIKEWGYPTKLIVGSIREAISAQDAANAGAHVLTVGPDILSKWIDHRYSRDTVRGFNADAQTALAEMKRLQAHQT